VLGLQDACADGHSICFGVVVCGYPFGCRILYLVHFVENKVKVAMQLETESAANFLIHLMQMNRGKVFSPKKLEKLQKAIVKRLQWRYRDFWFPDKPYKASNYRCVRISNGKLDPVLILACTDCKLWPDYVATLLPPNLAMWIDPQETSYRMGDGSICTLYEYPQSQPWMPKPKQAAAPPPSPPSEIRRTMMSQLCCCWL
jgi:hypothetical protein